MIRMVLARDVNYGIGMGDTLPWGHIAEDLKRFKTLTENSTVVMGHTTFKSIGKPLPKRRNVILTRSALRVIELEQAHKNVQGFLTMDTLVAWLETMKEKNHAVNIIGGASLYNNFVLLSLTDEIVETVVLGAYEVDTYVKPFDPDAFPVVKQETFTDSQTGISCITITRRRLDSK